MSSTVTKVLLDAVAARLVHEIALRENRSASNAASTLIRRAWAAAHQAERARPAPPPTRGGSK
jgi:hypothetical protein